MQNSFDLTGKTAIITGGNGGIGIGSKKYIAVSTGDSEGLGEYNLGDADLNPEQSSATISIFELRNIK